MRLILVRHGQTPSNVRGLLDTAEPGADLTDLGREQAVSLVDRLEGETISAINVSTLVRTQQTAAPLAAALDLEPEVLAEGREVSAGDLEMSGDKEDLHEYVSTIFAWVTEDPGVRLPGGETGTEVLERFDAQVASAVRRGREAGRGAVVVVAHGSVIRYWVASRTDADTSFIARHPLPNTGIVVLEGEPGDWRLESYDGVTPRDMEDALPDSESEHVARDERE